MILKNPLYNLEESLDLYLKSPLSDIRNIKIQIKSILEDESISNYPSISKEWLDLINIEDNLLEDMQLEIFYVVLLKKPFSYTLKAESESDIVTLPINKKRNNEDKVYQFNADDYLLIPESLINTDLTSNMQLEPNSYVLEFKFDYSLDYFKSPDELIEFIQEKVNEKTEDHLDISFRKIELYKEADVNSIFRLLKIYYYIDDTEYNRNSIRNILSGAIDSQVVVSKMRGTKIEISISPNNKRILVCTIYNRKNREVKEFKF